MITESIIMTVYNRPAVQLMNTLYWLAMSDLSETEVIVVDDGSTEPMPWLEPLLVQMGGKLVTMEPYEAFRIDGGYNAPSKAFNRGLEEAQGERLCILSSDVLVPPRVLAAARQCYRPDVIYCPMTIDLASTMEYCGPHRVFPMPWFLYLSRQVAIDAGGWDETYLLGSCWEDNDFVGRIALQTKRILCDWGSICWHQSHEQPAYRQDEAITISNQRNRVYTMDKWTGIPFATPDLLAFEMGRARDEDTGHIVLSFADVKGVKERVYLMTKSPFVRAETVA